MHKGYRDSIYVLHIYSKIKTLFSWMNIDCDALLFDIDRINRGCSQINRLKAKL